MQNGVIFNVQRFSIHDGPGVRTTVFLKGCPLNCAWCHNPESQSGNPQILVRLERCTGCGACMEACTQAVISIDQGKRVTAGGCHGCGSCLSHCPNRALELAGSRISVSEVIRQVQKDQIFYDESGGGVTFSGGEPLAQPAFLQALLEQCRKYGIHTAVDTSGYASWQVIEQLLPLVDLWLYDIKLVDEAQHLRYTGVSNQLILRNLEELTARHDNVHVRIPVIPGINDSMRDLQALSELLRPLPVQQVKLLAYHDYGMEKYQRLGYGYQLTDVRPPSEEHMQCVKQQLKFIGLPVVWR